MNSLLSAPSYVCIQALLNNQLHVSRVIPILPSHFNTPTVAKSPNFRKKEAIQTLFLLKLHPTKLLCHYGKNMPLLTGCSKNGR